MPAPTLALSHGSTQPAIPAGDYFRGRAAAPTYWPIQPDMATPHAQELMACWRKQQPAAGQPQECTILATTTLLPASCCLVAIHVTSRRPAAARPASPGRRRRVRQHSASRQGPAASTPCTPSPANCTPAPHLHRCARQRCWQAPQQPQLQPAHLPHAGACRHVPGPRHAPHGSVEPYLTHSPASLASQAAALMLIQRQHAWHYKHTKQVPETVPTRTRHPAVT